jgi:anaerobic dimethyl sulfoxide reductase subunit A
LLIRPTNTKTSTVTGQATTVTGPGQLTTVTTTAVSAPKTLSQQYMNSVVSNLVAQHSGETYQYFNCGCSQTINCGGGCCVFKAHLKNGAITTIEADDTFNNGIGREDANMNTTDLIQSHFSKRGCSLGYVWHKHANQPNRVLYPMKNVNGIRGPGAQFTRISWDEALQTVANQWNLMVQKYGPYSIQCPYYDNSDFDYLSSLTKAGTSVWGWCSYDPDRESGHLMAGIPGFSSGQKSSSGADMLVNAQQILLFGWNPSIFNFATNAFGWYLRMAREKGTPIILIDPRYTTDAEVMASQWIPIKPGTDAAMMLAMAYVLFNQNLWNPTSVAQNVEPTGFQNFQNYVLGTTDGTPKTPQWAQAICGIPAATITAIAQYFAAKPTWLFCHYGVFRKSRGENVARLHFTLNLMMGYTYLPGTHAGFVSFNANNAGTTSVTSGTPVATVIAKTGFTTQLVVRAHYWASAFNMWRQVQAGTLPITPNNGYTSWPGFKGISPMLAQFALTCGWRADLTTLNGYNPHMIWRGGNNTQAISGNTLCTACDSTDEMVKAYKSADFVGPMMVVTMNSTAYYGDIIMPLIESAIEAPSGFGIRAGGNYGGFMHVAPGGNLVPAPGQAWAYKNIFQDLANLLNPTLGPGYFSYYTTDANFGNDWMRYEQDSYNAFTTYWNQQGFAVPTFQEFQKGRYVNIDGFYTKTVSGFQTALPVPTKSGKFEVESWLLKDETQRGAGPHYDQIGQLYDDIPSDWKGWKSIPVYQPCVRGLEDADGIQYPLMLLTSHSRYRQHTAGWDNPYLQGELYRHAVHISAYDAAQRGIQDGDLCLVQNMKGKGLLTAYVTNRLLPGVVIIRQGAWYNPAPDGTDTEGNPHQFLGTLDSTIQQTTQGDGMVGPHATTLVQVSKYTGPMLNGQLPTGWATSTVS